MDQLASLSIIFFSATAFFPRLVLSSTLSRHKAGLLGGRKCSGIATFGERERKKHSYTCLGFSRKGVGWASKH